MKADDLPRKAIGIVLMVAGAAIACYSGLYGPAGLAGAVVAYGLSFGLIAGGLWLVLRGEGR